jgi:CDP-6-deoxy-D-xylo-4-hexulose-3-dehydrase
VRLVSGTDAGDSRRARIESEIAALVEEYFSIPGPEETRECPLAVPLYGAEEVTMALGSLLSQNVTMGARVRQFEEAFAELVGTRHAVMVNSGSSANLLALSAVASPTVPGGLRRGDEVIVPAVTWPTTVTPILQHGCVPVFVDIDPVTLNLQLDALEEACSPRTRAIFAVHLLGNPVAMGQLMRFARERELWVLEDTCESLGTVIDGSWAGTVGHIGTFSFYFSHHITTIEGGMLVTDDDRFADIAWSMRSHGWTREMRRRRALEEATPWIDPRFLFVHVGYNLRPTEVQAAFGLVQLRRLDEFNAARRRNATRLLEGLRDLDGKLQFVSEQEGGRSTWFGFPVIAQDGETRLALCRHLEANGIETRAIVAGNLAIQPAFREAPHRAVGDLPNASAVGKQGLFIGNHPNLDDRRLDHIVETFHSFFAKA